VARRAGHSITADINVTPMADIMLVLLIIFMITIPNMQKGVTVNLPKAKDPVPAIGSEKGFTVALDKGGRIFVGKKQVVERELYAQLHDRFQGKATTDKSIFLKADTAVPYGRVVQIVNGCRDAGVDRIGLMAEKEQTP
jgi:biopolymer transport protein TolR